MPSEIEMDDLSRSQQHTGEPNDSSAPDPRPAYDDPSAAYWAWGAGTVCATAAASLILFPRLLLFIAETGAIQRRAVLTPLESFLALHSGILLLAFTVSLVLNVPQSGLHLPSALPGEQAHPLLVPFTLACCLISFISFNTTSVGPLASLVCLGTGIIGVWGMWTILFQGSSYISKKTGADKRTSRFLFGNKSAASVKKKQWKQEQVRTR